MIKQENTLVLGAGRSGVGAAKLLTGYNVPVTVFDGNESLDVEAFLANFDEPGRGKVRVCLGELTDELIDWAELAVISPGIPIDHKWVGQLTEAGVPLIGELELAFRCEQGDVLAITGTNGKTTTTTLLGKIVEDAGKKTFVVGNIGTAYTQAAAQTETGTVTVAEVSSFQLESAPTFHPAVSAILNITPDHLNRHYTMECYEEVKERIAANQTEKEFCVLNYEDRRLNAYGAKCPAQVVWFSSARRLEQGIWLEDGVITYAIGDKSGTICHVDELQIIGTHNYENVMAACAMALAYGIDPDSIAKSVREFGGVAHRIEFVCEKDGVVYYNDSKGTNPDAAIRAISSMKRPTLLIGGGYDKGSDYKPWINAFDGKVKAFVLIGATKEAIRDAAVECGFDPAKIVMKETFDEAVDYCIEHSEPGDAVLLSPACASWGMFDDYEQRGDTFKELVRKG